MSEPLLSPTLTICTTLSLPCRFGIKSLRERSVLSEHKARFANANDVANAVMKCILKEGENLLMLMSDQRGMCSDGMLKD